MVQDGRQGRKTLKSPPPTDTTMYEIIHAEKELKAS